MVDGTRLPALIADYRGFELHDAGNLQEIASEIVGQRLPVDLAWQLQQKLHELANSSLPKDNPLRILVCPKCASPKLDVRKDYDGYSDSQVYFAICHECGWGEAKKAIET